MINKLSERYSKEAALSLIAVFFIGGMASIKAEAFAMNRNTAYPSHIHLSAPLIQQNRNAEELLGLPNFDSSAMNEIPVGESRFDKVRLSQSEVSTSPLMGGPGQPEMSSFKSVSSDNMVSPFTGDFSYNIPLLDVGGYPVNMFYNSGITMDQEASWVGLGWNINPGAINRNMRGLPDDFDGTDIITKRQSIRPDKTWGVSAGLGIKFGGLPLLDPSINVNLGLSFNNKLGVAANAGIHPALSLSAKGTDGKTSSLSYKATVGAALNLNSRNGASLTPSISFNRESQGGKLGTSASLGANYTYSSRLGLEGMHLNAGLSMSIRNAFETKNNINGEAKPHDLSANGTLNSSLSFVYPTILPSVQNIFTRSNYSLSYGFGPELGPLFPHARISGFYSESYIAQEDKITYHPAYGFLHYQDANSDPKALLDFNRINDGVYTPNSPAIALPVYTYDIFSITGEGTGGSFRAYRGDVGYMRDAYVETKDKALSLSLDAGYGNLVHGGAEFTQALSPTKVTQWKINNAAADVLQFKNNDSTYQAVYFKNPGEKAIPDVDFQNAIGGENLVRFKMANVKSGTPMLLPVLTQYDGNKNEIGDKPLSSLNTIKNKRDKRTQIITFLTGEEAARIGFDKKIYSYATDSNRIIFSADCNKAGIDSFKRTNELNSGSAPIPDDSRVDTFRKAHHISEIDVLGTDGRKYVYGLPVYNTRQVDVSFSIDNGDNITGKSHYTKDVDDNIGDDEDQENSGNRKGRDWYVQQEETPAYTHSFLLTELVSPNYVDVTGNGITEDDMGDAVKFNYSRFDKGIKWRTPVGDTSANYSEGLKTDPTDDKAHYIYGEREMWLLYSIESKNRVARFYVKNDRIDGRQVKGQWGGIDKDWGMQRLDKICLYSKGDLIKDGDNAKPIKTIRFFQSYKLCKGVGNSLDDQGKLTLDSIWMTYNGNDKKAKSRFIFSYPAGNNPDYDFNGSDRWGTYKPASENPDQLTNADYPYSLQDKAKADKYAAAWTMNKIILPSGGVINIKYESDDYAYVQNKKAASLQQIIGFGNSTNPDLTSVAVNQLYTKVYVERKATFPDNEYVYVKLPYPVSAGNDAEKLRELAARYFENTPQLYMKLSVTMPSGKNIPGAAGDEVIPVYADIASFGLIDSANGLSSTVAWVQVKKVENNLTPMTQQALQFLKQQLPGKAYKGYDLSETSGVKSVLMALAGMAASFKALRIGDDSVLRSENKCRIVSLERSFVRLTNPYLQKRGGGLRVKQVIINDNWNKMTGQYESTYGQEYKYTTKELINNKLCTISSGVAAWEPSVGPDENPHNEIMRFQNHNKGGPYDFGAIMLPLGEAFYPVPMVGYSRVEVLSIHRDTVKNLPTRQVTEFFTTKDFPFKSSYTSLIDPQAHSKYEPSPILQLLQLDMKKSITLSQGFLIDMNDMNGKEKMRATYSALDSVTPVSSTRNFYNVEMATDSTYKFNHNLPTIASAEGKVGNSIIGRDIELMADFREHTSETTTTNIDPSIDFFFLGIFPVPLTNLLRPTIYEGMTYRSASLLKIVNHYGVLDSVVVIDKGSMVSTKNLVYDAETGNALLTRTNNEHNQPIYNFTYPAHWAYSGMGQAYKNIDATYQHVNFSHGKLVHFEYGLNHFLNNVLESGDELYVVSEHNGNIDADGKCDENAGTDPWTTLAKNESNKIWAVNTGKASSANPKWIFMDRDGNPYNAMDVTMRIVRSGHRNMLDQNVGAVTSMNYPVKNNGKLKFNDAANIIQTGAATFKDHWRVDNSFYVVDSVVAVKTPVTVHKVSLVPESNLTVLLYHCYRKREGRGNYASSISNQNYFIAEQYSYDHKAKRSKHFLTSLAKYDLSSLPGDATVVTAKISLTSHYDETLPINKIIYHEFPPQECTSNGITDMTGAGANHRNIAPHQNGSLIGRGKDNSFKFTRVTKDWITVANNISGWTDYLTKSAYNGIEGAIAHDAPSGVTSNISFSVKDYGENCTDGRIDVSKIVRQMATHRNLPSIIKMELIKNNNYNLDDFNSCKETRVCFEPPTLDVYYYSCSENNSNASRNSVSPNVSVPSCDPNFPQYYCTTYQHRLFCFSKFTERKSVNPYAEGILGNWRIDTTFIYYGDRKESDPIEDVDTRTAGTIVNYKDFWDLSNTGEGYLARNITNKNVWVWNSTITQYNRKGYEIENKDPLGRFNAGLYGYNQQLPIAVVNNSRLREALFDGFEDYDYNTSQSCLTCKPHRSFNYSTTIADHLDATQHHTGLKSLRIEAGQSISIVAPVTDGLTADQDYGLRMRMDSVKYKDTAVVGRGTGLEGVYDQPKYKTGPWYNRKTHPAHHFTRIDTSINFKWGTDGPGQGMETDHFTVVWTGKIQPKYSELYTFKSTTDDGITVKIDNAILFSSNTPKTSSGSIYLIAGNTYNITIDYNEKTSTAYTNLQWESESQPSEIVPMSQLYPPGHYSDANGTVTITESKWCTRLDSVNTRSNALTDTFSLLQNKKMLVSAWVKEGGDDCKCSSYVRNNITVSYTKPNGQQVVEEPMYATGSIIEGWQRYEGLFTVHKKAVSIKISLNNTRNDSAVYFDDIRIHPFNANMKSFVYHASNLRLMSELDENNYATFYEYDDDGTLTRVKKETERGIKTITETRSAMQKVISNEP